MEFVVDRVSEDSFYENLLIGLPKILENLPNITNLYLERYPPVSHNLICAWEQKYGVLLPDDLRSFYASTNGLLYTYTFSYISGDEKCEENSSPVVNGRIDVNGLNSLIQVYGGYDVTPSDPGVKTVEGERYELKLGPESRIFELVNLCEIARIILVYINPRYLPTIWIWHHTMKFYFLADDFTTYLRMCVHHLGIPFWQFAYTPDGIPEWTEMIFRLLTPNNLPVNRKIEDLRENNNCLRNRNDQDFTELPVNKIDSNIFKTSRATVAVAPGPAIASMPLLEQPNPLSPRQLRKKRGKVKILPAKLTGNKTCSPNRRK